MVQVSRVTERAKTSSETRTSDIASGQPRRRCLFLILETPTIKNKGTFMIRASVAYFFRRRTKATYCYRTRLSSDVRDRLKITQQMSKLPCLRRLLFLGTRRLSSAIFLYFHTCTYFCSRCCRKL